MTMSVVVLQSGKDTEILEEIIATISGVLAELQVEVSLVKLNKIPYYKGYDTQEAQEILEQINQAVGVVIVSRVELLSISGSLCTFFEYCSNYKGHDLFKKPLFAITSSDWRGEREAAEHILHIWDILGGVEFGKLGVYGPAYRNDQENILANLERMSEDFYRMIKQNRAPIKSSDHLAFAKQENQQVTAFEHKLKQESKKYQKDNTAQDSQEKDIEDLANFFKKQLHEVEDEEADIPKPKLKSTRHMLGSLPHYFQAQFDGDFEAVIQYHLLSDQPYSGYVTIEDGACSFSEGVYQGAEVELTAQEKIIEDILTKKITAQKAFMLGQLKVRGNFMLLSKIDQMFKAM